MSYNYFKRVSALALSGILAVGSISAKTGEPHTFTAKGNFRDVAMSWAAPNSEKVLKWHNDYAYNGDSGPCADPQKPAVFWSSALFLADDLTANVGDLVESISFYQYRPVTEAYVQVYVDDQLVSEAKVDPAKFEKDKFIKVDLPVKVAIQAGKNYRFAVKWVAGSNMDMVAIKDQGTAVPGRGDQFSTDGKTWTSTGAGDYLIQANLVNEADEAPTHYNVYRGTAKINAAPVTETELTLVNEPEGKAAYCVSAVYADGSELKSAPVELSLKSHESYLAGPNFDVNTVTDLDVNLAWTAPLRGGSSLTWGNSEVGLSIGGTATSNTKIWIRNQFSASDLIPYVGGKISAIKTVFSEKTVTGMTVWVMVDGVLTYSQAVSADVIAGIEAGKEVKIALDKPVTIEAGHDYAYGLYLLQTPKTRPIAISKAATVDVKGNSFSTSSPNAVDFLKSKPSFKTLRSGGYEGNWLLSADIEGAKPAHGDYTFDLYRDGQLVKAGITTLTYDDKVDKLGTYEYTLVSRDAQGAESLPVSTNVTVKLPAAYSAPVLTANNWDVNTRTVSAAWTTDKELTKHGEATYVAGFDEDMDMMWGAQFTADELAAYKGYTINKLKFVVGAEIGEFKVGVYTNKGVAKSEITLPVGAVEPLGFYTITLDQPVTITGEEDLILAYSGHIPGGKSALILDEGPLAANGARVSLTGGVTWMNLGTINPSYNKYNIVISALAGESAPESARSIELTNTGVVENAVSTVVPVFDREYGLATVAPVFAPVRPAVAAKPVVESFNIYRNGEKVFNTKKNEFSEVLSRYNEYTYYVTTVFTNGWESPASASFTVNNRIAQNARAPYGLEFVDLLHDQYVAGTPHLKWKSPEDAVVMTYAPDEKVGGIGMTGNNPTSHVASKFSVEDLKPYVGHKVDRIRFGLYEADVNSLSVMVMYGENIVYSQSVPVSTLKSGINEVVLNEPVEIPAGVEVGIGYKTQYATGMKPLGLTSNEAVSGYGDLISSSAGAGYWYSLNTKFKVNNNFWLEATFRTPDNEYGEIPVAAPALNQSAPKYTYNIYLNGTLIETGVKETEKVLSGNSAPYGYYTVTAVDADGKESAHSNSCFYGSSGVEEISADDVNAPVEYFNLQGVKIDNPTPGSTVIRRQGSTSVKVLVK